MKLRTMLMITAAMSAINLSAAIAEGTSAQSFTHPSNDVSYSQDMRDDRAFAQAESPSTTTEGSVAQTSPVSDNDSAQPSPTTADDTTQPDKAKSVVQTNDGTVEFVSGGVADSGMQAIDEEQHHYNLKLTLVNKAGEYLADVHVIITDKAGATIVDTQTKGPVLLARVPSGKYKIDTTTSGGESVTKTVTLGAKMSSLTLRYAGGKTNRLNYYEN